MITLSSLMLIACSSCPTKSSQITTGGNYSGCNLAGMSFKGRDLTNIDFSGANLAGSDFRMTDLKNTNFKNAYLVGANFQAASGTALFFGANLNSVKFTNGEICQIGSIGKCLIQKGK